MADEHLHKASEVLTQLGFTDTEALIYGWLLQNPGATGYGVAKSINKSQANVYTALARLTHKGIVSIDNGETTTYRAIPASELLPRLSKEFQDKCAEAEAALATLGTSVVDDNIYQLRNSAQVYERAANMCVRARDSIAFELFDRPFARLQPSLSEAVSRGVGVAGVTFRSEDIVPGATCVLAAKAARAAAWPGDQLTIIIDGKEALVALFDRGAGEVMHSVYTDSVYLSCLLHAAVVDATTLNRENLPILRSSLNKIFFGKIPGGFLQLIAEQRGEAGP